MSTRASSTASLNELVGVARKGSKDKGGKDNQTTRVVEKQQSSRRRKLVLVAVAAVLYAVWSRYIGRLMKRSDKWGWGRLALMGAAGVSSLAGMLGITGWSQIAANPSSCAPKRQTLLCFHPHGCFVLGAIVNVAREPRNKHSPYYGTFVGVADALFKIPFVREFLLLLNARPASAKMTEKLLSSGNTVAICPGGIHEQLATDSKQERLFFPPNLGFVRQAMKHGTPLVPLYTFGENQLYDVPAWSRQLSAKFKKHTGFGFPLPIGRYGIPFVPKKTTLESHIGRAIEVGEANPSPTDAMVRKVFLRYCAELHRLFSEHSASALPADVAARGLKLIWRGHDSEDLTPNALAPYMHSSEVALCPETQRHLEESTLPQPIKRVRAQSDGLAASASASGLVSSASASRL